jgi:hypothetical protein
MFTRAFVISLLSLHLNACAQIQRADMAKKAQGSMVGLSRAQVLSCMGPPANKQSDGSTEVWQYASGNGYQVADYDNGSVVSSARFCTVNVVMLDGVVSRLSYLGPTGGLLSAGEQCAFAVQGCL